MRQRSASFGIVVLTCGGAGAGCSLEAPADKQVGALASPLFQGELVGEDLARYSGFVGLYVDGEYACSGTLFTNSALVTAKHCVDAQFGVNGQAERVTVAQGQGDTRQVRQVSEIWYPLSNRDYALLLVAEPFEMITPYGLSTSRYERRFATPESGAALQCYSMGPTCEACDGGELNRGEWTSNVVETEDNDLVYQFWLNPAGQTFVPGDSGSGCILYSTNPFEGSLATIHSGGFAGLSSIGEAAFALYGEEWVPSE